MRENDSTSMPDNQLFFAHLGRIYNRDSTHATAYNWNLGGINCNEDCGEVAIGIRTSDELLDKTAACPLEWLGRINTTVVILPDGNEWYCIDTFGDAHNQRPVFISHPYHGDLWVIRMDFAVSDPLSFEYNQQLIYEWSSEWRPVSELNEEN